MEHKNPWDLEIFNVFVYAVPVVLSFTYQSLSFEADNGQPISGSGGNVVMHCILYIECSLATEPGISLIVLTPVKILQRNMNRNTLFSLTFRTQWGKSASNFVAISSLVVKLLKKYPVRKRVGHRVHTHAVSSCWRCSGRNVVCMIWTARENDATMSLLSCRQQVYSSIKKCLFCGGTSVFCASTCAIDNGNAATGLSILVSRVLGDDRSKH
jgi:hypothetical protein